MGCCAVGTNGCFDLRRRAFALDGQVSVEWSRCPGSMERPARDSVAPASRLRSATLDVSFLRSDSRCRRYVMVLSNVTPRYLGSEQKGWVALLYLTLSSRLAFLLLRWKAADNVFVVLSYSI